ADAEEEGLVVRRAWRRRRGLEQASWDLERKGVVVNHLFRSQVVIAVFLGQGAKESGPPLVGVPFLVSGAAADVRVGIGQSAVAILFIAERRRWRDAVVWSPAGLEGERAKDPFVFDALGGAENVEGELAADRVAVAQAAG